MNDKLLEKYYSMLDDYLDGQLNKEELTELESAIRQNPKLKTVLEKHINARANIRVLGEQKQKQFFLSEFEKINRTPKLQPRRNWWQVASAAAVIMGMLFCGWYLMSGTSSNSPVDIAQYLDAPSPIVLRGQEDQKYASQWNEMLRLYEEKNYEEVLAIIADLERDSVAYSQHEGKMKIYAGLSHLQLYQYETAEQYFTGISDQNPHYDLGQWYLALTFIGSEQKNKARYQLEKIEDNRSHFRHQQAKDLLRKLH